MYDYKLLRWHSDWDAARRRRIARPDRRPGTGGRRRQIDRDRLADTPVLHGGRRLFRSDVCGEDAPGDRPERPTGRIQNGVGVLSAARDQFKVTS